MFQWYGDQVSFSVIYCGSAEPWRMNQVELPPLDFISVDMTAQTQLYYTDTKPSNPVYCY